MEGYINENRWVDFSGLPRVQQKRGKVIDWKNSAGYDMPFLYDGVEGYIHICRCDSASHNQFLYITIDKYVPTPKRIPRSQLFRGLIGRLVGNRIADNAPEMIKYLYDKDDAYLYPCQYNGYIRVKCPYCGYEDMKQPSHIYNEGFSCKVCSDNISIPNKLMLNILRQLNIPFIREVSKRYFSWMKQYLYDFYIQIYGRDILIEMDGGFHTHGGEWGKDQRKRDKIKDDLAHEHDFDVIRIDCDYVGNDPVDYIRNNILYSRLINLLDIDKVDWDLCRQSTKTNLLIAACNLWNEGYSVAEITRQLQVAKITIFRYLARGKAFGLCPSYNTETSKARGHARALKPRSYTRRQDSIKNPIAVMENGEVIYVFRTPYECERESINVFNEKYRNDKIYAVLSGQRKKYHGKTFKKISKEEYIQYKMILNNSSSFNKEVATNAGTKKD